VLACRTADDAFHVKGREVYWLCRTGFSESTVDGAALGRAIGLSTNRNLNTVRRLLERFAAASPAAARPARRAARVKASAQPRGGRRRA
jgi:hypothetical protein